MAYDSRSYVAPQWDTSGFDWYNANEVMGQEGMQNLLLNSPFASAVPTMANGAVNTHSDEPAQFDIGSVPAGYRIGGQKLNNKLRQVMVDENGNIVGSYEGVARSSLNSDDYALMATMATLGYGAAGGFGAMGGAGALGGDTAALGAGQVGALEAGAGLGAAEGAGSYFGTTFGGAGSLGEAGLMTGGAAGGGGLTSGAAFGGAGAAGGLGGLSGNTWANLAQTGVGLLAQNRATNAMTDANNAQLGLQRDMWQQNRADNQPLLDLRNQTLPQINALMRDPSSITQDPGYQFGLKQGQGQIDNSSAAKGGYYSGAQLKATQRYGQDYAGTKLDQSLNRLMGVAGLGQIGGTNNQSNNNQFSQQQGNALMNGGNIRGSGYMGMANTIGNGISGIYNDNQQNYWNQRNPFGGP